MAQKKPIVLNTNGELEQLQPGDFIGEVDQVSLTNSDAAPAAIGEVFYIFGASSVKKARADAVGTTDAFYFATQAIASAAVGFFQSDGVLAGFVGLTPGATYFLSQTTAGAITTTAPTTAGQFVVRLGKALSTTEFAIRIERYIKL